MRMNMLSQEHEEKEVLKSRREHSLLLLRLAPNLEKTHRTTGRKSSSEKTQPNALPRVKERAHPACDWGAHTLEGSCFYV